MSDLTYDSLSDLEKALICNGCGNKGGYIRGPSFLFVADCNRHDFAYWQGGSSQDRKRSDYGFYKAMRQDAGYNPIYQVVALVYFLAVRIAGHNYFQYRESKKTREDLETEFANKLNLIINRQLS